MRFVAGESPCAQAGSVAQLQAQRRIADGAGDADQVARLGRRAKHHPAGRHLPDGGDRQGQRPLRLHGIAAEERAGEIPRGLAQTRRECGEPRFGPARPARRGQQEAGRIGALGGEIGDVHAERLAGDGAGGILGQEMHALDQGIDGEHQIVPRASAQAGGVVLEAQPAFAGDGARSSGRSGCLSLRAVPRRLLGRSKAVGA